MKRKTRPTLCRWGENNTLERFIHGDLRAWVENGRVDEERPAQAIGAVNRPAPACASVFTNALSSLKLHHASSCRRKTLPVVAAEEHKKKVQTEQNTLEYIKLHIHPDVYEYTKQQHEYDSPRARQRPRCSKYGSALPPSAVSPGVHSFFSVYVC